MIGLRSARRGVAGDYVGDIRASDRVSPGLQNPALVVGAKLRGLRVIRGGCMRPTADLME